MRGPRAGFYDHLAIAAVAAVILLAGTADIGAWGPQGHRLVALIAADRLTPAGTQVVALLLPDRSLADVANWADQMVGDVAQTGPWHYLNIPPDATAYDRDRDCPRQPGVAAGSRNDRWRDCAVDRILYFEERLADASLDRAERATALKFLVHVIGDLHQPLHALGVARGGNDIPIVPFGASACAYQDGTPYTCNLHAVWDLTLVERRRLTDQRYFEALGRLIADRKLDERPAGTPAAWAMESHALAKAALVPAQGAIEDAYYQQHVSTVDERLALGGLRLAAVLNRSLAPGARAQD